MILTVTLNAAIDKRYVVEKFVPFTVGRVKECTYSAGGKGLNVSRIAATYGEEVVATGFLGGHSGAYIAEAIENDGVKSAFLFTKGESRSCINIYDETTKQQTELLEPGITVTKEELDAFLAHYEILVQKADVVSISGSVPKGVPVTYYSELIKIARKYKKPVLMDTSGDLLERNLEAIPDMIKPNDDEIAMLTGKEQLSEEELIEEACKLHQKGITYTVISLGKRGSLTACHDGIFRARVPQFKPVNTVGCGDAMTAGYAIGIAKKMSGEDTVRLASAISSASSMCAGTGEFHLEDLEGMLAQIEVEKISR